MFGRTFSNGRALTTLKLHDNKDLIVEDKLVLGADYYFILDSLYSVPVGTAILITLNNCPVETDSKLMAHDFTDTHGILSTPALYAIILHGANLIDCTIVHARITTNPHDANRQKNERLYAESLGLNELAFPYKSEKKVLEMMRDREKYYEQNKIPNKITRKNLDIAYDDEIFDPYGIESSRTSVVDIVRNIRNLNRIPDAITDNTEEEEDELKDIEDDDIDNDDGEKEESFDDFLKLMNNPEVNNTEGVVPVLAKMTEAYMNSLSKLLRDRDISKSDMVELEKWSEEFEDRLESEFAPIMEKMQKAANNDSDECCIIDDTTNATIITDETVTAETK